MSDEKRMRTLMQRLETAINRLEDIADLKIAAPSLAGEEPRSNNSDGASGNHVLTPDISKELSSISSFDKFQEQYLLAYMSTSERIGSVVLEQAQIVQQAFLCIRAIIEIAASSSKPVSGSEEYLEFLRPLQIELNRVTALRDSNRPSPLFSHLSTVADGIPAAGWVAVETTPVPYISDMYDSAQFYANRVIKDFKEKDVSHVEWARSFLALLRGLKDYVKEHHTTGLVWNVQGDALKIVLAKHSSTTPIESLNSSPPPPPGPPPPPMFIDSGDKAVTGSDMNSVFAELNRGALVTSGLKKVDKTQMTHKNPALRASSIVPELRTQSGAALKSAKQTTEKKRLPRKELEGTKWIVEHFTDNPNIVIDCVEINQTVYVYNCTNCTLQIKGKFNALSVDSATKCGIVVDSLVSSVDLVKTNSFALQILGKCPTVICDVCDSGQIYLAKEALDCELVTSKSNSINLNVPSGDDGQFKEEAVPEMLKHKFIGGKLETTIVVHAD